MDSTLISENDVVNARSGDTLTRITEAGGRKFRATVHWNHYAFQSYARVDLWDGDKWNTVVTLAGEHPVMKAHEEFSREDIARMLESQAREIAL